MRGKGEPAPRGVGEAGDLFIELEIEPHRWFERSGSDLIMSLPLGYADLLLGTTVELEHLDGKPLVIKVPAHSNSVRPLKFESEVCRDNEEVAVVMLSSCSSCTCRRRSQRRLRKAWKDSSGPRTKGH